MKRLKTCLLLMLPFTAPAVADAIEAIPSHWSGRLDPIPPQRLTELEKDKAARIVDTRERLAGMLTADDVDTTELASLYGRLGALYGAQRMYAGAERALRNARTLDPGAFQWVYYAVHLALEQGEAEQALDRLADAERLDPDYPPLPLRRGEALYGLNRLDEARAAYAMALDRPGLGAAALYGLAQIDLLERDWDTAATRLQEVLAEQPEAVAAHYPLGRALVGLGRREAARPHLAQRGENRPSYPDALVEALRSLQVGARFHYETALAAIRRQDYQAAADAFRRGLVETPGNTRARTSLARALWLAGQHAEARHELRQAADQAPGEALPHFLIAVLRDAAGEADTAVDSYLRVLTIDPRHEGALSYLANLHLRRGDTPRAIARFEQAIDAGMTQMPLYLHYWSALQRAGTADAELRDRLVAFDRRFPEPPVFRFLLGRLLATSNQEGVADPARARQIAEALVAAQPIPPHAELLALALAADSEFGKAAAMQQTVVEMARAAGDWTRAAELTRALETYRAGRLPQNPGLQQDPMPTPPPIDADLVMRNYPAGRPY